METEPVRRPGDEAPFLHTTDRAEPTDREIHADVWKIAWPSVLTFSLMTTNSILDRMFVGRLGSEALAAVGFGGQVVFLVVSLSMAVSTGTTALVARFYGAGDQASAIRATGQSLALGLWGGLLCTALVWLSVEPLLGLVQLTPSARAQCGDFIRMSLIGMTPVFLVSVLGAAFRGLGDTKSPLRVMLCAIVAHILGDLTLMLGYFGAPKLGVAGGGIALSLANVTALAVYVMIVRRSGLSDAFRNPHIRLTREWAVRILRIGIPAAVTALLRVTSLMGFTGVLSRTAEQTGAVASLLIGMTAESIAFMPGFGYSVAASALVGQALGAGEPKHAERYAWGANLQAVVVMGVMGVVFFVGAGWFADLFTNDPTVHRLAVEYLRIMALSEPMLAVGMVLTGALQGAGDTLRPTIITAISFWLFRIPAAWLFALSLGYNARGAWLAMATTTVLGGILTWAVFRAGAWKGVDV
jgi:putative MATE family efflux protein